MKDPSKYSSEWFLTVKNGGHRVYQRDLCKNCGRTSTTRPTQSSPTRSSRSKSGTSRFTSSCASTRGFVKSRPNSTCPTEPFASASSATPEHSTRPLGVDWPRENRQSVRLSRPEGPRARPALRHPSKMRRRLDRVTPPRQPRGGVADRLYRWISSLRPAR